MRYTKVTFKPPPPCTCFSDFKEPKVQETLLGGSLGLLKKPKIQGTLLGGSLGLLKTSKIQETLLDPGGHYYASRERFRGHTEDTHRYIRRYQGLFEAYLDLCCPGERSEPAILSDSWRLSGGFEALLVHLRGRL